MKAIKAWALIIFLIAPYIWVGMITHWTAGLILSLPMVIIICMLINGHHKSNDTGKALIEIVENIRKINDHQNGAIKKVILEIQKHDSRLSQVEAVVLKNQFKVRPH